MNKNKLKQGRKVWIILLFFIPIFGWIYSIYHSNKTKYLNVILINLDALRADHLSCYAYKRSTTPNIDKLAEEGVLFTNAISQSSFTPSAIYSMLTSVYPSIHGVYDYGMFMNQGLQTLPDILKDNGYYLGLISGRGKMAEFHFPEVERKFDFYYPSDSKYISAAEVTRCAIEWIRLNKKKKFFLWLYYLEPHAPYRPPLPYADLYAADRFMSTERKHIPISDNPNELFDGYGVIPRIVAVQNITDVDYYISQYDGYIRFADEQIGMVLAELKKANLYDKTLIILTSDHGEFMGEHNFYFVHSVHVYEPVIRVPLILKCSGILPRDKVIDQEVGHIDIVPTITDLIGIRTKLKTSGMSLVPILSKDEQYPSRVIFSDYLKGKEDFLVSARTNEWKLIYDSSSQRYELYNLKEDAVESINVIGTEKNIFKSLESEIKNYLEHRATFASNGSKQIFDQQTKKKLRSLGYAQ